MSNFNEKSSDTRQQIRKQFESLTIKLSANERLLYNSLLDACDISNLSVAKSLNELSNETFLSKNTIKSCREKLRALKLIDFIKEENSLTVYQIKNLSENDQNIANINIDEETSNTNIASDQNTETEQYSDPLTVSNSNKERQLVQADELNNSFGTQSAVIDYSTIDNDTAPLMKLWVKNQTKLKNNTSQKDVENYYNELIQRTQFNSEKMLRSLKMAISIQLSLIEEADTLDDSGINFDFVDNEIVDDVRVFVLARMQTEKIINQPQIEQLYNSFMSAENGNLIKVGQMFRILTQNLQ